MRYYKITGLDQGLEIEPYVVDDDSLDRALVQRGDMCREYEHIGPLEARSLTLLQRSRKVRAFRAYMASDHETCSKEEVEEAVAILLHHFNLDHREILNEGVLPTDPKYIRDFLGNI